MKAETSETPPPPCQRLPPRIHIYQKFSPDPAGPLAAYFHHLCPWGCWWFWSLGEMLPISTTRQHAPTPPQPSPFRRWPCAWEQRSSTWRHRSGLGAQNWTLTQPPDHRFNLFFLFTTSANDTAALKPFEGNVASTNCLASGKEMRFSTRIR